MSNQCQCHLEGQRLYWKCLRLYTCKDRKKSVHTLSEVADTKKIPSTSEKDTTRNTSIPIFRGSSGLDIDTSSSAYLWLIWELNMSANLIYDR